MTKKRIPTPRQQKFEIKHRWSGAVLYTATFPASCKSSLVALALAAAVAHGANLRSADLSGANLSGANLSGADLSGANLSGANLSGADLRSANLSGANLSGANLRSADLSGANLRSANLRSADLSGANLSGANLSGANLSGANLSGAVNSSVALARTVIVAQGTLTVWKKLLNGDIATLRIPEGARRSSAAGRKCRAEYAEVVEISGGKLRGKSQHDTSFIYEVGKTVRCAAWCEDRWQECAGGIHFYLTREEAEAH